MEDDNEDELKNKEDLHIAGMHTALDIFRFAVFLNFEAVCRKNFKYICENDKLGLSFAKLRSASSQLHTSIELGCEFK